MNFSKLCRPKRPFYLIGIIFKGNFNWDFFFKEIKLKHVSGKSLGEFVLFFYNFFVMF